MSPNKRIFLNIVVTYGRSLHALVAVFFYCVLGFGIHDGELSERVRMKKPRRTYWNYTSTVTRYEAKSDSERDKFDSIAEQFVVDSKENL